MHAGMDLTKCMYLHLNIWLVNIQTWQLSLPPCPPAQRLESSMVWTKCLEQSLLSHTGTDTSISMSLTAPPYSIVPQPKNLIQSLTSLFSPIRVTLTHHLGRTVQYQGLTIILSHRKAPLSKINRYLAKEYILYSPLLFSWTTCRLDVDMPWVWPDLLWTSYYL